MYELILDDRTLIIFSKYIRGRGTAQNIKYGWL